ncbi:regulator of V-ATPase in vacuolar membrane protein 1 [Colletotrichum spaethianum]|uniref:Regulator of V-ATPase in vacuolar membrane protein 1 n=1 Tax=Colletotrichum spaethianum TaxID=700344 RepID=A0AA37LBU7_9PEZI|nr:regulator of V-ATPase in vacuolar membrane protein 1 [Colletotrichum spaethianum]GKT43105.1 regulator of V-ATPase in vacuolar membrane protein 1 [Colletotrichum spaethianum]
MNQTIHAVTRPLRRDHYLTPVTGLSFFKAKDHETYILAGEDSELKIYDTEGRLRGQLKIFRAQPIHGIHVSAGGEDSQQRRHVLLWGNQAVTVIPASVVEELILRDGKKDEPSTPLDIVEAKAPDWIYDGVISPKEPGRGVLVTAHNEVLEFFIGDDGRALEFGRIISPSRPILYSANLTWISETSVLVAGGTVFGEIIVWKCHFSGDMAEPEKKPWSEVLFVFTGHEGSIFGVDISSEVDIGNGRKARLLASCSDDRTIRIWDITERPEAPRLQYDAFGEARETGFGGAAAAAAAAAADLTATQVASSAPLAMAMGHISRIWHVRFPQTLGELARGSATTVYSFGEDSTLQTWSLEINVEQWRRRSLTPATADEVQVGAKITHTETYARHDGKHIWATALTETAGGEVVVATGGADSKINLLSDRSRTVSDGMSNVKDLPSELRTLVMRDVIGKLPARNPDFAIPSEVKEAFHRFAFISREALLATSTTGRLLVGTFGAELTWSEVGTDAETLQSLRACTSLKSPAPGVALLGTASKRVFLYKDSAIQQIGTVPGKIADIFCLSDASGASKLEFLVTMLGGEEAMQILTLDLETLTITSMVPVPELDSRFVVTAACQVNDLLFLGSRHGYMSVFRRTDGQLSTLAAPDRRTNDAITSINPLPTSSSCSATSHIITTSRDGNYRIYEVSPAASSSPIRLRHETAPTAVPNLEDAWLAETDLILCGFRSKNFIVWNETRHEELLRVDCGGAHRAFAYTPQVGGRGGGLRFVFNKAATLGVYVQPHASAAVVNHRTLKRGSHGREVRTIAYSGRRYIATGAEDTAIRIWEYAAVPESSSRRELRCVKVIKVHTAGLQSLRWLGEELLFSCSGNEEFMVWRATDLGDVAGLGLMREAVFADRSADGDLRITSFDVERLEDGAAAITMAFSNSFVKTYRYTADDGFELLFKGQYTGACLTQARHLRVRDGVFDVVTAATDGCLAVWRSAGAEYVLRHTARVHQSSVKALDVHSSSADKVVILTGGDDNALGITTLDLSADGGFAPVARAGVRKAHAAAINGLTVLRATEDNKEVVLATASNDQRVKMWKLTWRGGVEEVTLVADEYSGVADAGDVEVIGDGKVVVGGVGLEVWDWSRMDG